jgi:hypothetical protein
MSPVKAHIPQGCSPALPSGKPADKHIFIHRLRGFSQITDEGSCRSNTSIMTARLIENLRQSAKSADNHFSIHPQIFWKTSGQAHFYPQIAGFSQITDEGSCRSNTSIMTALLLENPRHSVDLRITGKFSESPISPRVPYGLVRLSSWNTTRSSKAVATLR